MTGDDSVTARWMRPPVSLDGWRIDVANMTGRHGADDYAGDVARGMRRTMAAIKPDHVLVAEHNHDYTDDLDRRRLAGEHELRRVHAPGVELARRPGRPGDRTSSGCPSPSRAGPAPR